MWIAATLCLRRNIACSRVGIVLCLAGLALSLSSALSAFAADREPHQSEIVTISEAKLWLNQPANFLTQELQKNNDDFLSVTFPDYWNVSRRKLGVQGWYVVDVVLPAQPAQEEPELALLIPNASGLVSVYWDSKIVGSSVPLTGVGIPIIAGPMMFTLPATSHAPKIHTLALRFQGVPGMVNFVRAPLIGPMSALQPIFVKKRITLVYLPLALGAVSVFFAFIFFAAYRHDPWARGISWLSLGLVAATWSVLGMYLSPPDYLAEAAARFRPMTYHLSFLFYLFALSQTYDQYKRITWLVTGIYLAFLAAMIVVEEVNIYKVAVYWALVTYTLGLYLLYLVGRLAMHPPRRWLTLFLVLLVAVFTAHDLAGIGAQGQFWADQLLTIYNPALMAFALMLVLISRTQMHLQTVLTLNHDLESRVAQVHRELEDNYEHMAAAEQREAVLNERERMVQEMHDGLGGQLVSTLSMVESGKFSAAEIEAALRDSLDDLRIMVHSLDQQEASLTDLLAMVRERVEPRITRQGMRFKWQVEDIPGMGTLSPESAGHILRILQESITNIIKHAQATTITLATGTTDNRRYVSVSDDGVGLHDARQHASHNVLSGRGLRHMRERANRIGGHLTVEPTEQGHGTKVTLWFDL